VSATPAGLPPEAAEPLMRAVTGTRWFAGKGRRAEYRTFTPLPWLDGGTGPDAGAGTPDGTDGAGPRVRLGVLEVGYPDEGAVEVYQLALSYRRSPVADLAAAELFRDGDDTVYDAAQDPEAASVLLAALLESREVADETGRVRFHLRDAGALRADLVPQVFRGQQSNTSVMYGDVAMLKLFRRLELGRNLDVQVHAALGDAGVADVADLYGWVEATWTSDGEVLGADLAMCVEKLADAEDGWDLALTTLRDGGADGRADGFAGHADALGRALALTHAALRDAFGTTDVPGATTGATMRQRLDAAAAVAPALDPWVTGLRNRFGALEGVDLDTQRVHGDFHLGQTLHTPSGWKIIDFEGEPAKTLAERVAPDAVWRDVAGMMRSFDYAAATVPGENAQAWRDACREAFLTGYTDGRGLGPDDEGLLAAYEADKAVYEVVYEVRNRPDWVEIPLSALAALAGAPQSSPTPHQGEAR